MFYVNNNNVCMLKITKERNSEKYLHAVILPAAILLR